MESLQDSATDFCGWRSMAGTTAGRIDFLELRARSWLRVKGRSWEVGDGMVTRPVPRPAVQQRAGLNPGGGASHVGSRCRERLPILVIFPALDRIGPG